MSIRKPFLFTLLITSCILVIHWATVSISGTLSFEGQAEFNIGFLASDYSYFALLGCTLLVPLVLSFDQKVHYVGKWRYLLAPFLFISLPYLVWDILFTKWGIWGFNEQYVSDIQVFSLPLEEVLFFIVIPFACIFIYECVKSYGISKYIGLFSKWLIRLGGVIAFICILLFWDRYYTFSAGLVATVMIIYIELQLRKEVRDNIYTSIFVSFIPFLLINGILTGIATVAPIVVYNMDENLGSRFFSIPLDDFIYQTGLLAALLISYHISRPSQVASKIYA